VGIAESKTILVTGGAGFIGSALICELNNRGFDNIVVADFLGVGDKFLNLVPLRFADYVEAETLLDLVKKNDAKVGKITHIFHLGACACTTERDASYLIKNNYEYTKELAHFAVKSNIRFVYASSAATYGDGAMGMSDRETIANLRPLNMYAYSKQLFDLYALGNKLPIYGLKYFNIFGPNEYHKGNMRSMVLKSYESILATGKAFLFKSERPEYENGAQMRDLLYVKDAVDMTLFFGDVAGTGNAGVYNIGSSVASTWIDLVMPIFDAMGRKIDIEFIEMPAELKNKYQYYTRADISKLRNIGYNGKITPLRDAVADYVKNYLICGEKRLEPQTDA
jgi:ADP-L-glycero-D-manno-heptose 6-epimerase